MVFIKFHVEQNLMGTKRLRSFTIIQILKVNNQMIHLKLGPKEDYCVNNGKLDLCSCSVLNIVNEGIFCLENMWRCYLFSSPIQSKET